MPLQLRRDIVLALSVKFVLLAALLVVLTLAIPRPVADDTATATAVLGVSPPPPAVDASQEPR